MTKIYLAIAFLITGFLVGDAYGEDWDDEKAKSLGIPVIPDGAVIMCESELRTGFDWENGTYRKATFKKIKRILKKVEPSKGCQFLKLDPSSNYLGKFIGYRQVCIKHNVFGKEPRKRGGECNEIYTDREDGTWEAMIECVNKTGLNFVPLIELSPNGFYHLSDMNGNVSSKPKNDYKDSSLIEWGKCATISP